MKHCVKIVKIRRFLFNPNTGKYGTEKNSLFGHFSRSENNLNYDKTLTPKRIFFTKLNLKI